jgi:hypothetical protein
MSRMLHSTVLRRIFKPIGFFTGIALAIASINTWAPASVPRITMSMVPHTLLGAALSLLLVFRTNSSYARFVGGCCYQAPEAQHCVRATREQAGGTFSCAVPACAIWGMWHICALLAWAAA